MQRLRSLLISITMVLLSASTAFAAPDLSRVQNFATNVIQVLVTIAGLLAAGFFVMGGIGYITSSGNPENLDRSKKILVYSSIGLAVCIGALVLSGIFPHLLEPLSFIRHLPPAVGAVLSSLTGVIAGGGITYLVGVFGKLVFRKEAMGFGDVKLMAMLGGFLGWQAIIYVFFIGCFFGAIVGGISWFITKKHYLPFGPYLALGALVMRFFSPAVITFAMETYPGFIRNLFLI